MIYKELLRINEVLSLVNGHLFLFQNVSSYNKNNRYAKFDKNLRVGSISVE